MTTDNSGLVHHLGYADSLNVAISICLTYTLIFTCVRVHLRRNSFGVDDVVVIVATVAVIAHFAASYACLTAGLGKPYDVIKENIGRLSSTAIASAVTFVLALYAAKIAALVFLMRIQSKTRSTYFYPILILVYSVLAVASAMTIAAGCPPASGYYWDFAGNKGSCPSEEGRWQAITVLDIISEVILLALPINLLWSLQMPQKRKVMVVVTFWTRIPTIALSVIRQIYTSKLASPSSVDVSLSSTLVTILMAVELTYALISCTLTTSKNFTDGFSTGFGMGHMPGAAESYNLSAVGSSTGPRTHGAGYKSNITTTKATNTGTQLSGYRFHVKTPSLGDEVDGPLQLRPSIQGLESRTIVQAGEQRYWGEHESVSSDGGHDDLVIVRHTEYTVSHDEAPILQESSLDRM
ncbi:unnamed protein product [Aureobasidium uvarum]|uniref:Rhodopsin domain-containing protein n=1 Tax=Aureobasidium uvarum TaxID=2773716 RepID=A0A9N8KLD0_9PEZI|nr:unnamed protein product [Aureobasidium uvarum]